MSMIRLSWIPVALFIAGSAFAAPVPNVGFQDFRLESAECTGGAFVMKLEKFMEMLETLCLEPKTSGSAPKGPGYDKKWAECVRTELKDVADFDRDAVLDIVARPGQATFDITIDSNGREALRSLRTATLDSHETIDLIFSRAGVTEIDDYEIDLGPLDALKGNHGLVAMVPVKRRILSDLMYVFTEGCSLHWAR